MPDIRIDGDIELVTAGEITVNNMNDLTRSIQDGQLIIRSYDATGTTTVLDRVYPTFGVPSDLMDSTDTAVSGRSMAITHAATTGTISLTVGDTFASNLIWSGRSGRQRTRGRSVVRRNHRGMAPRAVTVDFSTATPAELTALQLLRGLVGQDEFRRYLKYGFIMVRGASGLRYQIKRGRHVIDVWNERGRVHGICVYLAGNYPPTDDTITRMLMAERDELELWRKGNSSLGRNATLADLHQLYGKAAVAA